MSSFQNDCPYCGTKQAGFETVWDTISLEHDKSWDTTARCGVCKRLALVSLFDRGSFVGGGKDYTTPIEYSKAYRLLKRYEIKRFLPNTPAISSPESTPENVAKAFIEAESALRANLYSSAASGYRKTVERAVKSLFPEGQGMLNARIRELEKKGMLPKTLIDLLDGVKALGNTSMHEEDIDPTREECESVREFTVLFLTYSFTLPAQIAVLKGGLQKQK